MAIEPLTLQQTIETAAAHHDAVSAEIKTPEIRVYETKTSRVLANGEIRDYTVKQHYVVKKKTGICKTELKKRESKLRGEITAMLHNLEIPHLIQLRELCQQLNDRPYVPGNPLDALRKFPEHLPPNAHSIKYQDWIRSQSQTSGPLSQLDGKNGITASASTFSSDTLAIPAQIPGLLA